MAKSTKSGSGPLAIELLEADHRKVEKLFKQYDEAKEADDEGRQEIAEQVCDELTVHAQVEEEIFYPWLRENLPEKRMELVEEAEVEHASAKDLIAQLKSAGDPDEAYDAKVKVLSEYIKHHVKEEEEEIFPELSGFTKELDKLGQQMKARKTELRSDLGLVEGEEERVPAGARPQATKKRVDGASRAR